MKPADAEAWEKHIRLERELLAQRHYGKFAKATGKALPGRSRRLLGNRTAAIECFRKFRRVAVLARPLCFLPPVI